MSSRTIPQQLHQLRFDPETKRVKCTCPAFRYRGRCSHIKFYKETFLKMIEGGVEDEKRE